MAGDKKETPQWGLAFLDSEDAAAYAKKAGGHVEHVGTVFVVLEGKDAGQDATTTTEDSK